MPIRLALLLSLAICIPPTPAAYAADMQWWSTSSPNAAPNGSITLKNASGASRTIISNPTGANLSTRSANTQAPTVVVQATASLPIKAVGDACTASTSGTAPNQTAGEGTAITADRSMLLTCQSGVWAKQGSGLGNFTFKVPGVSSPYWTPADQWYVGTGMYSAGKFSGQLICSPAYGSSCGGGRNYYCGADPNCVEYYAGFGNGSSSFRGDYVVMVKDLSIASVSQNW